MKQARPKKSDEEVRTLILAGAKAEVTRLRRLLHDHGRDMSVAELPDPGDEYVLRVARADGTVRLCSTLSYDVSFLLFGGGGLLADVMPDRSVAEITNLLERSPELVADTLTWINRDRYAAQDRLAAALETLPVF